MDVDVCSEEVRSVDSLRHRAPIKQDTSFFFLWLTILQIPLRPCGGCRQKVDELGTLVAHDEAILFLFTAPQFCSTSARLSICTARPCPAVKLDDTLCLILLHGSNFRQAPLSEYTGGQSNQRGSIIRQYSACDQIMFHVL